VWPRLHPDLLVVVFVGGCVGGWARYALTSAWPSADDAFPSATLTVNLVGAFVLGAVVVLAAELPSRYLRPLVGTGFCGALTTFSAVVVAVARLVSLGSTATAVGYLCATIAGGLLAAYAGVVTGRLLLGRRHRSDGGEGSA